MKHTDLLKKYDVPVPRYTSYPTVPFWSDSPTSDEWTASVRRAFERAEATWALYLHLPFCESLCTYCGCNTVITRSHNREQPYVEKLHRELGLYLERVPALAIKPLRQMHLGGGTPTFLSAQNLDHLMRGIFDRVQKDARFEGSLEVDPRHTDQTQLEVFRRYGFSRVSMGVQDFDPEVQRLVNRIQPREQTESLTRIARELGYTSVNYDLIYGLPRQTPESFADTIRQTIELRPDRIALYSLAVVPWIKPQQRLFKDEDLPHGPEKRALYELGYERLLKAGYVEIGMDHFALPEEALNRARLNKKMHRNFMGYTESRTDVLLGLGVSAISETPDCFHQNEKVIALYERKLDEGSLPTLRGHKLTDEDRRYREQILQFMTQGAVELLPSQIEDVKAFLASMLEDGLVNLRGRELVLTEKGRPFMRNACVALDQRLRNKNPGARVFSQAL